MFQNVIYRFKFLIILTTLCAALTVIFFIIGQVSESEHKLSEPNYLQYPSAFLTGKYSSFRCLPAAHLIKIKAIPFHLNMLYYRLLISVIAVFRGRISNTVNKPVPICWLMHCRKKLRAHMLLVNHT